MSKNMKIIIKLHQKIKQKSWNQKVLEKIKIEDLNLDEEEEEDQQEEIEEETNEEFMEDPMEGELGEEEEINGEEMEEREGKV